MELVAINWESLFFLETSILELIIRSSVLYFGILVLFRLAPRRTGGELAMMDLIFVFLIAEAASHALGDYTSILDGFVIIITLLAWNFSLNVLSYYFPFIEKMVSAPPLQVVKDGVLLRRNMRKEYLTEEELLDYMRKEDIDDIKSVKAAYVDGDGKITILTKKN